jgi:general secretion pathway protein G
MERNTKTGRKRRYLRNGSGFTFLELVMVITMLGILISIAVPVYQAQVRISKESVLEHNLAIIRERLDQYKADRGNYPTSLQELVERGYLREIPKDPITERHEWEEIYEDYNPDDPEGELGIYDVRSFSTHAGTSGELYSEW